jgi:Transglutaminase-like superfamily
MRMFLLRVSLCLLVASPVYAWETPAKVVKDAWYAAYVKQKVGGARCGYFHISVLESESDGQKLYTSTLEMSLTIKRADNLVKMRVRTGTTETAAGKITGLNFTQFLDGGKQQTLTGDVKDGQLQLRLGDRLLGPAQPWNDKALGLYAQDRLPRERKVKPGDTMEFLNFELGLQMAVPLKAQVQKPEEVDWLEVDNTDPNNPGVRHSRRNLMRLDIGSEKIEIQGKSTQLPGLTNWLDEDFQMVRGQMELPGIGVITVYRTTEAVAKQEGIAPALLPDLLLDNYIKLDRAIDGLDAAKKVVYRVTVKNDDDPQTIFAQDARQRVRNLKDNTFELEVQALRGPREGQEPAKVGEEFLKSSFLLDSDSPAVKEVAEKAVGDETDVWKKCLRIEKWVHDNMKGDSGIGYVSASTIARKLKGDCRQHSMLSAAMCRAVGVPARTAIGLVYAHVRGKDPVLAFHMWTEVWVQNQWLAVDAVWGVGGVGAGHLKITDHSWGDAQSLAPLLPLLRAMGKIKVEVVSVE